MRKLLTLSIAALALVSLTGCDRCGGGLCGGGSRPMGLFSGGGWGRSSNYGCCYDNCDSCNSCCGGGGYNVGYGGGMDGEVISDGGVITNGGVIGGGAPGCCN